MKHLLSLALVLSFSTVAGAQVVNCNDVQIEAGIRLDNLAEKELLSRAEMSDLPAGLGYFYEFCEEIKTTNLDFGMETVSYSDYANESKKFTNKYLSSCGDRGNMRLLKMEIDSHVEKSEVRDEEIGYVVSICFE